MCCMDDIHPYWMLKIPSLILMTLESILEAANASRNVQNLRRVFQFMN